MNPALLTDEQKMIQEMAERFAKEKLYDGYRERALKHDPLDRGLILEMGELGLLSPNIPEEFGGIGAGSYVNGLICEAIAYSDFNMSYLNMTNPLISDVIMRFGSEEMKHEVLPKMASGELISALGLTEPRGGSDAGNLILKAERTDTGYLLNGEKTSMTYATQADNVLMFARTGTVESGPYGVSAFLVDLNLPGVSRTVFDDIGCKPVGRGSVFFDNVEIPASALLGNENEGFTKIMVGFDLSRVLIALQCLGAAQVSVDETWQYVQEREAFGLPLVKFQGVSFPLAEHESMLQALRALSYQTLNLRDGGHVHTSEAAILKWMGPKYATDIIQSCLLLNGHYGYTTDLPIQQRMLDVMGLQIGDGTAQIMKSIIAREKVGKIALQYK
jgi:cyclohexanecarboxyl-CoA dehydrogenase